MTNKPCPYAQLPPDKITVMCDHGRFVDIQYIRSKQTTGYPACKFSMVPSRNISPDELPANIGEEMKAKLKTLWMQMKNISSTFTGKDKEEIEKHLTFSDVVMLTWDGGSPPAKLEVNGPSGVEEIDKKGNKYKIPCAYRHEGFAIKKRNTTEWRKGGYTFLEEKQQSAKAGVDSKAWNKTRKGLGKFGIDTVFFIGKSLWSMTEILTYWHKPTQYVINGLPAPYNSLHLLVYNPAQWKLTLSMPPMFAFDSSSTSKEEAKWEWQHAKTTMSSNKDPKAVEDRYEWMTDWFNCVKLERENAPVQIDAFKALGFLINIIFLLLNAIFAIIRAARESAPENMWHLDFKANFLTGSFGVEWGWAEYKNHQTFYRVAAGIDINLIELGFEFGVGYQGMGCAAQIFVSVDFSLPLAIQFEKEVPLSDIRSQEKLFSTSLAAEVPVGIHTRLMAFYILEIEPIFAETGLRTQLDADIKLQKRFFGGSLEIDFIGVTFGAKIGIGKGGFLGLTKVAKVKLVPEVRLLKTKLFTAEYSETFPDVEIDDIFDTIMEVLQEKRVDDITKAFMMKKLDDNIQEQKEMKKRIKKSFVRSFIPAIQLQIHFFKKVKTFFGIGFKGYNEIPREKLARLMAEKIYASKPTKKLHRVAIDGLCDNIRCKLISKGSKGLYSSSKWYQKESSAHWACKVSEDIFNQFMNSELPNLINTLPNRLP